MTKTESKLCCKCAKGLFPSMTEEQAQLLTERTAGYGFAVTLAAIKTNAANARDGWFVMSSLLAGVQAAHERSRESKERKDAEKIIDWLRAAKEPGMVNYDGWTDADAIDNHFRAAWSAVSQGKADEYGKAYMRCAIMETAFMAFREIGASGADANQWSRNCVGLADGERIVMPEVFEFGESK